MQSIPASAHPTDLLIPQLSGPPALSKYLRLLIYKHLDLPDLCSSIAVLSKGERVLLPAAALLDQERDLSIAHVPQDSRRLAALQYSLNLCTRLSLHLSEDSFCQEAFLQLMKSLPAKLRQGGHINLSLSLNHKTLGDTFSKLEKSGLPVAYNLVEVYCWPQKKRVFRPLPLASVRELYVFDFNISLSHISHMRSLETLFLQNCTVNNDLQGGLPGIKNVHIDSCNI
jgi:hypothetical protein